MHVEIQIYARIFCRVQVVSSGFSMRLFCFVQAKTLWLYIFFGCTRACVCVDVMVMSSADAMK